MGRLSKEKKQVIEFLLQNLEVFTDEMLDRESFNDETGLDPELIDESLAWIMKRVGV